MNTLLRPPTDFRTLVRARIGLYDVGDTMPCHPGNATRMQVDKGTSGSKIRGPDRMSRL